MFNPATLFKPVFFDLTDTKRKAWTTVLVDRGAALGKDRLQYSTPVYVDNATAFQLYMNAGKATFPKLGDHRLYQWDGKKWIDAFEPGLQPHERRR